MRKIQRLKTIQYQFAFITRKPFPVYVFKHIVA